MGKSKQLFTAGVFLFNLLIVSACGSPAQPDAPLTTVPTVAPARSTATSAPRPSPFIATPTPAAPARPVVLPDQMRGAHWSHTLRGLTLAMFFDPSPPEMTGSTTYRAMLADASGQPITDALVEMNVVAGMSGMEGEHDEMFDFKLAHQGNGGYTLRSSVSGTNDRLSRIEIIIKRGGQTWQFSIGKDEISSR